MPPPQSSCHGLRTRSDHIRPQPASRSHRKFGFLPRFESPITFTTFGKTAHCSKLHAIILRYLTLQCTAIGTSRSISGGATLKLLSGHQEAPSM